MPSPEPPSTPDNPPRPAPGPWDAFTDCELLRVLEEVMAHPLDDPDAHGSVCAQLVGELLLRHLMQSPDNGNSTAVY